MMHGTSTASRQRNRPPPSSSSSYRERSRSQRMARESAQSRRATAGGRSMTSLEEDGFGLWETNIHPLQSSPSDISLGLTKNAHGSSDRHPLAVVSESPTHRYKVLTASRSLDQEIQPDIPQAGFMKNYHRHEKEGGSPRQSKTWRRVYGGGKSETSTREPETAGVQVRALGVRTVNASEAIPTSPMAPRRKFSSNRKVDASGKMRGRTLQSAKNAISSFMKEQTAKSREQRRNRSRSPDRHSPRESLSSQQQIQRIVTSIDNPQLLDGFVLLNASGAELPDAAVTANLLDQNLADVEEDDLQYFVRLEKLNVSINHLNLEPMRKLPALVELQISGNDITDIVLPMREDEELDGFQRLEVLDLSHNQLSTAAIAALADMPRLRHLDISHNNLRKLPPPSVMANFVALEVLNANDNYLTEPQGGSCYPESPEAAYQEEHVLTSLSCMPSLHTLNLSRNYISTIPELVAIGWLDENGEQTHTLPPFCALKSIDLSYNLLQEEEHIVDLVAYTPRLQEVKLTGNPLTETSRHAMGSSKGGGKASKAEGGGGDQEELLDEFHQVDNEDDQHSLSTQNLLKILREETLHTSETLNALIPPHSVEEQAHSLSDIHGSGAKGRSVKITLAEPQEESANTKSPNRSQSLKSFSPMRTSAQSVSVRESKSKEEDDRQHQPENAIQYVQQMSTMSSAPQEEVGESQSFLESTADIRRAVNLQERKNADVDTDTLNTSIPLSILREAAGRSEEVNHSKGAQTRQAMASLRDILAKPMS
eukprot:gb/GECG01005175.1/.p1 GENE.gb/GECG01005175.1/~~gb/GECG01005175.1/.p1  ORF type:complete len:767 (+),score=105.97 gb/GECG01005175.1/:1-2301(+)